MVQHVMAERRAGGYAYARSATLCYSALFHAGRFDELLAVLALDPKPYWYDQQWAAKALAVRGDVDGAVALMEGLRSGHTPDIALSAVTERLLLDAGRVDEAYARYGIEATSANTHISTFRAIAKRYPAIDPNRILAGLACQEVGIRSGNMVRAGKIFKLGIMARSNLGPLPMTTKLLSLEDLPRQSASQVKNKWGELVRQVRQSGSVAVTNHAAVEMVLIDAARYRQLTEEIQALQSREQSAMDELAERFKARLAVLQEADAAGKVRSVLESRGKLAKRPKAGASF